MSVPDKVARYYADAKAAAADWVALLKQFDRTFVYEGGDLFQPLENDLPAEELRYGVRQECGDVTESALWKSVREFARAIRWIGDYDPNGSAKRVDTELLDAWADEIEFASVITNQSEKLVGLTLRVRTECEAFAEAAECHCKLKQQARKLEPGQVDERTPKLPLNAIVLHLIEKHGTQECGAWSVRTWALNIEPHWGRSPSISRICKLPAYVMLRGLFNENKQAKTEKLTFRDAKGKRRPTPF